MELTQIYQHLMAPHVEQGWDECLSEWEGATEPEIAATRAWITDVRANLLEVAQDIDDAETRAVTLAIGYVEMKSRWIQMNNQIQYRCVRGDEPNMSAVYRASLISTFLVALEPLLRQDDLERITLFLAQPIQPMETSELRAA